MASASAQHAEDRRPSNDGEEEANLKLEIISILGRRCHVDDDSGLISPTSSCSPCSSQSQSPVQLGSPQTSPELSNVDSSSQIGFIENLQINASDITSEGNLSASESGADQHHFSQTRSANRSEQWPHSRAKKIRRLPVKSPGDSEECASASDGCVSRPLFFSLDVNSTDLPSSTGASQFATPPPNDAPPTVLPRVDEGVGLTSKAGSGRKLCPPSLMLWFPSRRENIELKILVQPESQHRARYMTEGSRGAVKDESQLGYPKVQLCGYHKPVTLQVYIGTDSAKTKPHAFYQVCRVSSKNSSHCEQRTVEGCNVIEMDMTPVDNMMTVVDCAGILKLRNSDVMHGGSMIKGKRKSTKARMVFRVTFETTSYTRTTLQASSTPITCTQPIGLPEIGRISFDTCKASGGIDLFIIGKNFRKTGLEVKFQEASEDDSGTSNSWQSVADLDMEYFQPSHIICTVPPFHDQSITSPAVTQLTVVCGGRSGDPVSFTYTPNDDVNVVDLEPTSAMPENSIMPKHSDQVPNMKIDNLDKRQEPVLEHSFAELPAYGKGGSHKQIVCAASIMFPTNELAHSSLTAPCVLASAFTRATTTLVVTKPTSIASTIPVLGSIPKGPSQPGHAAQVSSVYGVSCGAGQVNPVPTAIPISTIHLEFGLRKGEPLYSMKHFADQMPSLSHEIKPASPQPVSPSGMSIPVRITGNLNASKKACEDQNEPKSHLNLSSISDTPFTATLPSGAIPVRMFAPCLNSSSFMPAPGLQTNSFAPTCLFTSLSAHHEIEESKQSAGHCHSTFGHSHTMAWPPVSFQSLADTTSLNPSQPVCHSDISTSMMTSNEGVLAITTVGSTQPIDHTLTLQGPGEYLHSKEAHVSALPSDGVQHNVGEAQISHVSAVAATGLNSVPAVVHHGSSFVVDDGDANSAHPHISTQQSDALMKGAPAPIIATHQPEEQYRDYNESSAQSYNMTSVMPEHAQVSPELGHSTIIAVGTHTQEVVTHQMSPDNAQPPAEHQTHPVDQTENFGFHLAPTPAVGISDQQPVLLHADPGCPRPHLISAPSGLVPNPHQEYANTLADNDQAYAEVVHNVAEDTTCSASMHHSSIASADPSVLPGFMSVSDNAPHPNPSYGMQHDTYRQVHGGSVDAGSLQASATAFQASVADVASKEAFIRSHHAGGLELHGVSISDGAKLTNQVPQVNLQMGLPAASSVDLMDGHSNPPFSGYSVSKPYFNPAVATETVKPDIQEPPPAYPSQQLAAGSIYAPKIVPDYGPAGHVEVTNLHALNDSTCHVLANVCPPVRSNDQDVHMAPAAETSDWDQTVQHAKPQHHQFLSEKDNFTAVSAPANPPDDLFIEAKPVVFESEQRNLKVSTQDVAQWQETIPSSAQPASVVQEPFQHVPDQVNVNSPQYSHDGSQASLGHTPKTSPVGNMTTQQISPHEPEQRTVAKPVVPAPVLKSEATVPAAPQEAPSSAVQQSELPKLTVEEVEHYLQTQQ